MNQVAQLLGRQEEAKAYQVLATRVHRAFNDSFYHAKTKQYATGSQTANAMALYMRLAPAKDRPAILENIIRDVRKNGLTAGDIGYHYLLAVLHEAGRDDVIHDMNRRSDIPGYGMQIAKGATALTESWAALPTNSNNHFMLGHLMEWLHRGLAGIGQEEGSVGWRTVRIRPRPVGDIRSAEGSYESPYGRILSSWRKTGKAFELSVEIPANSEGMIYLPVHAGARVTESGKPIRSAPGVTVLSATPDQMRLRVGSGRYHFVVNP
jgi:alpha-L-rhamnosidase